MDLGDKIKVARSQKGITQKELAEKTGLTERTIQRIENHEVEPSIYSLNKISETLSIDETSFQNQLQLFPNPTNGLINIKTNLNTLDTIKVFSLTGKKVLEMDVNTTETAFNMNVSKLAKGTYLMVFFKKNQFKASKKIIIE